MRLGPHSRRGVTLALGLTAALIIGEAALQVLVRLDLLPDGNDFVDFVVQLDAVPIDASIYRYSEDEILAVELIPGARRGSVRVNRYGFRGPDFPERPQAGTVRVAFVGDSETFGAALAESDTIVAAVARELAARDPERRFEGLNFGFPGYNTEQEAHLLETRVLRFAPDVVILYYVMNDPVAGISRILERKAYHRSFVVLALRWFYHLYVPSAYFHRDTDRDRALVEHYHALHASPGFERQAALIGHMDALARDAGAVLIVVIAPELVAFDSFRDYPFGAIHERLAGLADDGILVVDPLEDLAVAGHAPREYWVSRTDPHKNALANAIIAPRIAGAVLRAVP